MKFSRVTYVGLFFILKIQLKSTFVGEDAVGSREGRKLSKY